MSDAPALNHNSSAFDIALERFNRSGYMLARFETLMEAVRDERLNRSALRVLAVLIQTMNHTTLTSWVGYETIMVEAELESTKSVQNYISQLGSLGYITAARRPTPEAGNRVLRHYTLSKLSPEEIEAAISHAVASINGRIETVVGVNFSQPSGKVAEAFPSPVGNPHPVFPSRVGKSSADFPSRVGISQPSGKEQCFSQPSGNSTIPIITTVETPLEVSAPPKVELQTPINENPKPEKRATRMRAEWRLPKDWGDWSMEHFCMTREQVLREAEIFRDYWLARSDAKAAKKDWPATWRNWIRGHGGKPKYRPRKIDSSIAPDLESTSDAGDDMDAALERARQQAERR